MFFIKYTSNNISNDLQVFPVNGVKCINCKSVKFRQNSCRYKTCTVLRVTEYTACNAICILNGKQTKRLTLSTMKSMASAILESTGPLAKFPRTIFFSMNAGINQKLRGHDGKTANHVMNVHTEVNLCSTRQPFLYLLAVQVWLKIVVSLNELHSISECTLGDLCVYSANFCARNPPNEAPNRWT